MTAKCTCWEDVVCGACMTGAVDPVTGRPTPPADDVREPTEAEVTAGVRTILGGATKDAEQSMARDVRVILRAAAEVRPRGTVTDAEVDRMQAAMGERFGKLDVWWASKNRVRQFLEVARGVQS